MIRTLLITVFFISIFFAPWWFAVLLGVLLLAYTKDYVVVLCGGLLLDMVFGSPIISFFAFSYVYTLLFSVCALSAFLLRTRLVE